MLGTFLRVGSAPRAPRPISPWSPPAQASRRETRRTLPCPQRRNDLTTRRSTANGSRIHGHATSRRARLADSPGHVFDFLSQHATVDHAALLRSLHVLARWRRIAPLDPLLEPLERRPVAGQDRPQPVLEAAGRVALVIVGVDVRSVLELVLAVALPVANRLDELAVDVPDLPAKLRGETGIRTGPAALVSCERSAPRPAGSP